MKIAISPCPNDTYLFHAWITGLLGIPPKVTFADINKLNALASQGIYPLIKISFNCFRDVCETYQLLPIGSALGFDCGPKLIAKAPFPLEELSQKRIAIPGEKTTAHLLLEKFLPKAREKLFCLYDEVVPLINTEVVDCGLIIHETRFTFSKIPLYEIVDLGEMWHKQYALPLPLGGLVIKREYPDKDVLVRTLQKSLQYAHTHPEIARSFTLQYSQEKQLSVIEKHITTYVNDETRCLSETGKQAIETLTGLCLKDLLYLPKESKPTQLCTH